MKKRILYILLILIVVVFIVGCSKTPVATPNASAVDSASGDTINIDDINATNDLDLSSLDDLNVSDESP